MKVRITHLKAPWPSGASVGQVVAFEAGSVPAWAVGKCVPAGDDEEAHHTVAAPSAGTAGVAGDIESKLTQEERDQIGATLQRIHDEAGQAVRVLEVENAELRAQVAELQAKLSAGSAGGSDVSQQAAAERSQLEARAKLETEARELGIQFHPNIGDAKLAEKIAEKKGEAK